MKLKLALLATLLSVGLARGNESTLGSIEVPLPGGVHDGPPQETSSTIVKPTASKPLPGTEEAIELFKPETILAEIQSRIKDPKANVELEKLLTKVQDPEFFQKPEVAEQTFQDLLKITQNPAVQKAFQTFVEKPEVQAAVAEEMKAVAMIAEEMFLAEMLTGALDQVFYEEPMVFEFFPTDFPWFPLMDIVDLPKTIADLEKDKYHGNLFEALGLHNSIFASEEALKFVLEQGVAAARGEDAGAVFDYLRERNHAERYHQLMVEEKKMTLPQQEKSEPKMEEVKPKIEEVHDTSA